MDPLTILLTYLYSWIDTLHITIGSAIIAIAVIYAGRNVTLEKKIALPLIIGVLTAIIGSGVLIQASTLPQLYYPLMIFALGSGTAVAYITASHLTKQTLDWVVAFIGLHVSAYATVLLSGVLPFTGGSMFGIFVTGLIVSVILSFILLFCASKWNPEWTPWWISGEEEGRNAFLRKLKRKKT